MPAGCAVRVLSMRDILAQQTHDDLTMKIDQKTGIVDSLAQAAAITGFSKSMLRWAKKSGCSAFRTGSRVDLGELHKWLDANRDKLAENTSDREAVEVRLKLLKCDEQELINAKLRGGMHSTAEICEKLYARESE